MYLVDSNIFIEVLLRQERSEEVKQFLNRAPSENLYLTEFSLYSLGIVLLRRKMYDSYVRFVNDVLVSGAIRLVRLSAGDMESIAVNARKFNLDFDDAYQYVAAEKYGLTIVSFDSDFNRTERGRKTQAEVLTRL